MPVVRAVENNVVNLLISVTVAIEAAKFMCDHSCYGVMKSKLLLYFLDQQT